MSEPMIEPASGRPKVPEDYGLPQNNEGLLDWNYVDEQMHAARNYWICTATLQGVPAATPVWGVWVDNKLFFDGSPLTRRGRNITQNPRVVVHLESGDHVVILEGTARILTSAPDRDLAERVAEAYADKYADSGYSPEPTQWDHGGLFIFTPETVLGWTQFPQDMTRWTIK